MSYDAPLKSQLSRPRRPAAVRARAYQRAVRWKIFARSSHFAVSPPRRLSTRARRAEPVTAVVPLVVVAIVVDAAVNRMRTIGDSGGGALKSETTLETARRKTKQKNFESVLFFFFSQLPRSTLVNEHLETSVTSKRIACTIDVFERARTKRASFVRTHAANLIARVIISQRRASLRRRTRLWLRLRPRRRRRQRWRWRQVTRVASRRLINAPLARWLVCVSCAACARDRYGNWRRATLRGAARLERRHRLH